MNELSGAEAMVRMLKLHEVQHVFGLCGDTTLPLYDALYRTGQDIIHILTRDERCAAYMADAYARVTGKVGVCEGPSGGGATYLLPGVVEADQSSIPILAITTDISVSGRGRSTLTELDQEGLYRPLSKWNQVIDRSQDIPSVMRSAFRHMATGKPGAAHVGLPFDVQTGPVNESDVWADASLGSFPAWRVGPDPAAIEAAAEAILSAKSPMFICGGGVVISSAEGELARVAEALGAPVATTISGQGSIGEGHPLAVGVVGSNGGTPQTREIVDSADLIVLVGNRVGSVTTERWQHPTPGTARIVHIDIDPAVIGANYPTEVAVVGDARLALAALAVEFERRGTTGSGRGAAAAIARAKQAKFDMFRELSGSEETPIRPERLVAELQAVLPKDAVVICDPGTPCPYFSAFYEFMETGRHFISNRAHGALGYSLSAAVGARIGRPGAKTVAVMGDGSFGMTCGELETVKRLNLPITFVVVSNSVFGWIKAGQRAGYEKRFYSVDFSRTDQAAVAAAFGIRSWSVSDPGELRSTLAAATEADGPTLVDVLCQPLDEARAPVSEWIV
jgi:acetolactate synthase-1/2/3 large subunit